MRYVYDPAKDRANQAKHTVSLALAEVLFAGPHVSVTDDRLNMANFERSRSVSSMIGFCVCLC